MQKEKKPCVHDNIIIDREEKYSLYSNQEFFNIDFFPCIEPFICTNDCREKLKCFYQFKTEQFSKWVTRYCEDAKTVEDHPNEKEEEYSYKPCLSDYRCFFKGTKDPELQRPILQHMKVGLLDGKPIRLSDLPEGKKCDFDATNLEEFDKEYLESDGENE